MPRLFTPTRFPPSQAANLTFSLQARNYAGTASTNLTLSFKNRQTLTFPPFPLTYLSALPPSLSATSSSALPVAYASSHTNIARIFPDTNQQPLLDLRLPGQTIITASQPGDGEFLAAPPLAGTLWVLPDPVFPYSDSFSSPRPSDYLVSQSR